MPNNDEIENVPQEILTWIFHFIPPSESGRLARVSRFWNNAQKNNVLALKYFESYFPDHISDIKKKYSGRNIPWRIEFISLYQQHAAHFTPHQLNDYLALRTFNLVKIQKVLATPNGKNRVLMLDKDGLNFFDLLKTAKTVNESDRQIILDELFAAFRPLLSTQNKTGDIPYDKYALGRIGINLPPKMVFPQADYKSSALFFFAALCNQMELIESLPFNGSELELLLLISLCFNHHQLFKEKVEYLYCNSKLDLDYLIVLVLKALTAIRRLDLAPAFAKNLFDLLNQDKKSLATYFYSHCAISSPTASHSAEHHEALIINAVQFYFAVILKQDSFLQKITLLESDFLFHYEVCQILFKLSHRHAGDILNRCLERGCLLPPYAGGHRWVSLTPSERTMNKRFAEHPLYSLIKAHDIGVLRSLHGRGYLNPELMRYTLEASAFMGKAQCFEFVYAQHRNLIDEYVMAAAIYGGKPGILNIILRDNPSHKALITGNILNKANYKNPALLRCLLDHKVNLHQENDRKDTLLMSLSIYITNTPNAATQKHQLLEALKLLVTDHPDKNALTAAYLHMKDHYHKKGMTLINEAMKVMTSLNPAVNTSCLIM